MSLATRFRVFGKSIIGREEARRAKQTPGLKTEKQSSYKATISVISGYPAITRILSHGDKPGIVLLRRKPALKGQIKLVQKQLSRPFGAKTCKSEKLKATATIREIGAIRG